MTNHPLDIQTSTAKAGANVQTEANYKDFTSADTGATKTQVLFTLPAYYGIAVTTMELPEAFVSSDSTLISTSITVGDSGSNNRLLTATELNAAGTEIFNKPGVQTTVPFYFPTADTVVNIYWTATTNKALNSHTAGRVTINFCITNPFTGISAQIPFDITTVAAQ